MNKKILIGCVALALVGVIAGSIGLYFFVIRPAKDYVASLAKVGEISEMNNRISSAEPFSPPADSLLNTTQVDRFVRVQRLIVEKMGEHINTLKGKYESLNASGENRPGIAELATFWKDFSDTLLKVKEVQVDAMNREGFSLEEYTWVRERFYEALGANFVSLNLEKLAEAVQQQNPDLVEQGPDSNPTPEANRELVRPYGEEAGTWYAYAWLGL
jgi:hypothetical protein